MPANDEYQATALVDDAVSWLAERLPASWAAERMGGQSAAVGRQPEAQSKEIIVIRAPNGTFGTIPVEARTSLEPRDAERLLVGFGRKLREIINVPLLVVAPWLSPRTQEVLAEQRINFVDLTGNALVKLDNPALYLRSSGASRNPRPAPRGRAQVKGPKAARLVRLLLDVRPPYGVGEIARSAGLTAGYVSRLLETLDREALIERSHRGRVESVDVCGLLRRWAESYDVLKTNRASPFLASNGAGEAIRRVAEVVPAGAPPVITGSFAAMRLAPVTAPALLMIYCDDLAAVVEGLRLLPAEEGANVILLRPFDRVVWDRSTTKEKLLHAAPSQVAVDCLTGPGRMPAEGEALLDWMQKNESRWRLASLDDLPDVARR
jgi:hypothetical protein